MKVHDDHIEGGGKEVEGLGVAFNSLANAAHRGDRRVVLNPATGRRR